MMEHYFDLHIHTNYSDGMYSVKEAIQEAKLKNLSMLAITDHFTTSWKKSFIDTINESNYSKYIEDIKNERKLANYKCLIGIEVDMESNWSDIIKFPFNDFEIILFEYVSSITSLKQIIKLKEKLDVSPILCLAHNFFFQTADIEEFTQILVENDIYFELNSSYLPRFDTNSIQRLRILKDRGIQFTLGSDAHYKGKIGNINLSLEILKEINGMNNLINIKKINLKL